MAGLVGAKGPVNAVYHHNGSHKLSQWQWPQGSTRKTYYEPPPDRVHVHPAPMTVRRQLPGATDFSPEQILANTIVESTSVKEEDVKRPEGSVLQLGAEDTEHIEVDFGHEDFESVLATL